MLTKELARFGGKVSPTGGTARGVETISKADALAVWNDLAAKAPNGLPPAHLVKDVVDGLDVLLGMPNRQAPIGGGLFGDMGVDGDLGARFVDSVADAGAKKRMLVGRTNALNKVLKDAKTNPGAYADATVADLRRNFDEAKADLGAAQARMVTDLDAARGAIF